MEEPEHDVEFSGYSDEERLRVIRAAWLADVPMSAAWLVIGRAAFDGIENEE